jgi:DNA replication and repair protein RecF
MRYIPKSDRNAKIRKISTQKKLMHLENLSLQFFKNYAEAKLDFSGQINCFVGVNGSGKTNLLDAIHYLSMTRGAFHHIDNLHVKHDEPYFVLKGLFSKNSDPFQVLCSYQTGQKKVVKCNKKEYDRNSEHIGEFPVVLISPDDTLLIREGSEGRRKFFDSLLCQIDRNYLISLVEYNHLLKQRNALLKQFAERGRFAPDMIEPFDVALDQRSVPLFQKRMNLMKDFIPVFNQFYSFLTEEKEIVDISYESDLEEANLKSLLQAHIQKDRTLQRTTKGLHKDDFDFQIDGFPIKKFGSQGQQKSFVIALKLAQYEIIRKEKGFHPLLLLDDIFDKLDDKRMRKLMEMVAGNNFGQIFVTDARPERSRQLFEGIDSEIKFFTIQEGQVIDTQTL